MRKAVWKPIPSASKRSRRLAVASVQNAQETGLRRDVEKDREIGACIGNGDAFKFQNEAGIKLAERALIGAGRIGKSIRHDPGAARERRSDGLVDVINSRCGEEHRLADRAEPRGGARKEHIAQRLGLG